MKYRVNVCRIGYANNDVEVKAKNPSEAKKKALAEASSLDFSEHDSEYKVQAVSRSEQED